MIKQTPWQIVQQEFHCSHPRQEIRYWMAINNTKQFVLQCLDCGKKLGTPIKYDKIPNPDNIVAFDGVLRDNFDFKFKQRLEELQTASLIEYESNKPQQIDDFWDKYNNYLMSDKWRQKRKLVLKRDNYLCQACLLRRATQAHHLTYQHVFNEPLFDLVAVCDDCHEKITALDRERRNGHNTN